jgi:hypothetical protein
MARDYSITSEIAGKPDTTFDTPTFSSIYGSHESSYTQGFHIIVRSVTTILALQPDKYSCEVQTTETCQPPPPSRYCVATGLVKLRWNTLSKAMYLKRKVESREILREK